MQNRKKIVLILISTIIPLLLIIGISTWIILDKTIFAPRYNPNGDSILYNAFDGQSKDYNGQAQGPTSNDSTIQSENVSFSYRVADSTGFYTNGFPTNAGTYDILFKDKNDVYIDDVVRFTINKIEPTIVPPTLNSTTMYEGDNIGFTGGSATGINGETITGSFKYKNASGTTSLAYTGTASTYETNIIITFTPTNTNYLPKDVVLPITMLPVAYIKGTTNNYYGSIDKVLTAASNDSAENKIYIIPNLIEIGTTNLKTLYINSPCTIEKNDKFYLPIEIINNEEKIIDRGVFDEENDTSNENSSANRGEHGTTFSDINGASVKKYLKINIILNTSMTINGEMEIGGRLGSESRGIAGCTTGAYSQIQLTNEGQINCNGVIRCGGYIKKTIDNIFEENQLFLNANATLEMPFVLYDFNGGSYSTAAYGVGGIMPFNQWCLPNMQINAKIEYMSKVIGYYDAYNSTYQSVIIITLKKGHKYGNINVVGTTNSILNIKNNSYIEIRPQFIDVKYTSNSIVDNKSSTKFYINIYGTIDISSMIIPNPMPDLEGLKNFTNIPDAIGDVNTKNVFFAVPYFYDINVHGTLNINTKQKILPGCNVTIEKSGVLNLNAETIVYSSLDEKDAAKGYKYPTAFNNGCSIKNKGVININSSFGGKIENVSDEIEDVSKMSKINIKEGVFLNITSQEGSTGSYKREGSNLNFSFTMNEKAVTSEIARSILMNGNEAKEMNLNSPSQYKGIFYSDILSYYSYDITYINIFSNSNLLESDYSITNSNQIYFTNASSFAINNPNYTIINQEALDIKFDGYYLDENCANQIMTFEFEKIKSNINNNNLKIYAKWKEQKTGIDTIIINADGTIMKDYSLYMEKTENNEYTIRLPETLNFPDRIVDSVEMQGDNPEYKDLCTYSFKGWKITGDTTYNDKQIGVGASTTIDVISGGQVKFTPIIEITSVRYYLLTCTFNNTGTNEYIKCNILNLENLNEEEKTITSTCAIYVKENTQISIHYKGAAGFLSIGKRTVTLNTSGLVGSSLNGAYTNEGTKTATMGTKASSISISVS